MRHLKIFLIILFFQSYSSVAKTKMPGAIQANDSMTLMQAYINLSLTSKYFDSLPTKRINKILAFETKELASIKNKQFIALNDKLYNFSLSLLHYNKAKLLFRQKKVINRKVLLEWKKNLDKASSSFNDSKIEIAYFVDEPDNGFYALIHFNEESCYELKRNIKNLKDSFSSYFIEDIYGDFKRIYYTAKKTNIYHLDSLTYFVSIYNIPLSKLSLSRLEKNNTANYNTNLYIENTYHYAGKLEIINRYLEFTDLINNKANNQLGPDELCVLYSEYYKFRDDLVSMNKLLENDNFFKMEINQSVCDALFKRLEESFLFDYECLSPPGSAVVGAGSAYPEEKKYYFIAPKPSSKIYAINFQPDYTTNKYKNKYLREVLIGAGYIDHINYYYINGDGFAITTSLEKVNSDGKPKDAEHRWSASQSGVGTFSYYEVFNSIFFDIKSDYRLFAFIIDSKKAENRTKGASMTELQNLEKRSYKALPKDLEEKIAGNTLSIFVYQFHNDTMDGVPKMVINNKLDFGKYLKNSGLGKLLENKLTR